MLAFDHHRLRQRLIARGNHIARKARRDAGIRCPGDPNRRSGQSGNCTGRLQQAAARRHSILRHVTSYHGDPAVMDRLVLPHDMPGATYHTRVIRGTPPRQFNDVRDRRGPCG
jgi:hypothetical protein